MGRIVLFGATGYTGRLVAEALRPIDAPVTLAGRREDALRQLADQVSADGILVSDAHDGEALRDALDDGDVLVSTVGPFVHLGETALDAAIATGSHYLDSTGEPAFIRRVFADGAGARGCLLSAFGYDYVPGNLAGALALADAGEAATSLTVGYFTTGRPSGLGLSTGTLASIASISALPSHAYRDGTLRTERAARRVGRFELPGGDRTAISVGGSEHLSLPRIHPNLHDVDVHLGWTGPWSRAVQIGSAALDGILRVPGASRAFGALTVPFARRTGEGPDAEERARTGSLVVARAAAPDGTLLAEVELRGPNAYTLTAELLAWGAQRLAIDGPRRTGAVGPVEAFGLEVLRDACETLDLSRAR